MHLLGTYSFDQSAGEYTYSRIHIERRASANAATFYLKFTFVAPIEDPSTNIPHLKPDGTNWTVFSLRFRKAMQAMHRWEYFDGTKPRPTPKDPSAPTNAEIEALERWDHEDVVARYLLSQRLPDMTFMRLSQLKRAEPTSTST